MNEYLTVTDDGLFVTRPSNGRTYRLLCRNHPVPAVAIKQTQTGEYPVCGDCNEPCQHNGLFAVGAPDWNSRAEYVEWLDTTQRCHSCNTDVRNRDL